MCVIPGSEHDLAEHRRIDELTLSLNGDSASPALRFERGHAHKQLGHLDAALSDLTQVARTPGVDRHLLGRTQHFRAICLRRLGVFDEALQAADDAVSLDPRSPSTWAHRGYVQSAAGCQSAALADYDRSLSLAPHAATTYLFRGNGWAWQRKFVFALEDYDHAIDRFGSDLAFSVFHNRGVARLLSGDRIGARSDFDRAERMRPADLFHPLDPRPLACRGLLNLVEGNLDAADRDLHESSHLGYADAGVVAWALLEAKRGNTAEVTALGRVFAMEHPDGPEVGLLAFAGLVNNPLGFLPELQPIIG